MNSNPDSPVNLIDIDSLLQMLEQCTEKPEVLDRLSEDQRVKLLSLTGQISRPNRDLIRARNKSIAKNRKSLARESDKKNRAQTGIRAARETLVFSAPLKIESSDRKFSGELQSPRNCYVCKAEFTKLHFFYDSMCSNCGDFNYHKRFQTADLAGQYAIITGSRLKIGYHATLMLLRAGAHVIATTRFPIDSAKRFSKESDFSTWKDRLEIYGLDLRHTPSVEIFAQYMQRRLPRLDILINNAAQTVRRPPGFYAHMLSDEMAPIDTFSDDVRHLLSGFEKCKQELGAIPGSGFKLSGDSKVDSAIETPEVDAAAMPISWVQQSPAMGLHSSALLSQIPYSYDRSLPVSQVFPSGKLDQDLQQVDLRETNSWRYKLTDVPAAEMLEVQLVNAIAPFVLNSQLVPIMRRDFTGKKHLVNVTAMEGKFYRFKKEDRHPHTNMAKAALNMLTHTTSADLEKDGIFTNAVDTGWVTDEDPVQLAELKQQRHDFQPPLDIVDGAARVCDPIFYGINTGHHWSGKFLKDYQPIEW